MFAATPLMNIHAKLNYYVMNPRVAPSATCHRRPCQCPRAICCPAEQGRPSATVAALRSVQLSHFNDFHFR